MPLLHNPLHHYQGQVLLMPTMIYHKITLIPTLLLFFRGGALSTSSSGAGWIDKNSAAGNTLLKHNIRRNLNSHIDLHTHTGSKFDNHVTLTSDLLTSGSMYAERLPRTVYLPSLALIARVIFRIHTEAESHPIHAFAIASISNEQNQ